MTERLTIKNFGPIKDMSFEFRKINIFIGDQSTGKSTVAKLLTAIKNCIFREIFDLPEINNLDKETHQFYGHLNIVGIESFLKKDSLLIYSNSDFSFQLKEGRVTIDKNISGAEYIFFNFNYIVAERNMVNVLADSLYALLEVKAELPKLFLRFGNKFQSSRKSRSEFNYTKILGVKFTHKSGKDYIIISDGNEIKLSDASSGIQGCIALLTVVDSIMSETLSLSEGTEYLLDKNLKLLIIEEPELNCFPQTQNNLIKYIIENNKIPKKTTNLTGNREQDQIKNQLLITTHSPYILTSLNNLMYAFEVGKKEPEETNKIIDKKYWINPDDVSAYMLLTDGTSEDILDREEKLIKAEKIDGVSRVLNEEFEKLSNLEFARI